MGDSPGFHLQPEVLLRSAVLHKDEESVAFLIRLECADLQAGTRRRERQSFPGLAGGEMNSTLPAGHVATHKFAFPRQKDPAAADRHRLNKKDTMYR